MAKQKNKKEAGSFAVVKRGFQKVKTAIAIFVLAVVFVGGAGGYAWKVLHKPKSASQADTQTAANTLPNWWLQQYFGSSVCNAADCQPNADPDGDGLTNAQEYFYHSDPLNAYTVKDKLNDGQLVAAGFDPSRPGHMTFAQVASSDNILGDSLLFDTDIKQMVAQDNDISKVTIPLVPISNLKVTNDTSQAAAEKYYTDLNAAIQQYFPSADLSNIENILKSGDSASIADITSKSASLATELQSLTVPVQFQAYHQYLIALFQLMPQVLNVPDSEGPAMDTWYDKAQEFYAVEQKLSLQEQILDKTSTP